MKTRPLDKSDYAQWRPLWDQYLLFYQQELSEDQTQLTFERLVSTDSGIYGLVLEVENTILGFAHSSFTHSTWTENLDLYLEDLFVNPSSRGKGYGRALIEATVALATENGSTRVYWQTHKDNQAAQTLYKTLATKSEFVTYEIIV
jgi:GNAT superfamily N-acetyltransferase